jgi:hypothetical protein
MNVNLMSGALLVTSVALSAVGIVRWTSALPGSVADRITVSSLRASVPAATDSALAEAEDLTITNDPFRLSNSPSSVRYDPATDNPTSGIGSPVIAPPRPTLVLKAIVGGPPWQAVIDGIPGQPPGTLAVQGSKFDRILVKTITRDSVIVQGTDTVWVLSFRGRS